MPESYRIPITNWIVDYHDDRDPHPVTVPHAWKQEVAVTYEGPVTYRTVIDLPDSPIKLVFQGVSYQAQVFVDGEHALTHEGIWDAFEVPLTARSKSIEVVVKILKNGGQAFPVKEVASGFLPFVFHTFGGIHGEVYLVEASWPKADDLPAKPSRVRVEGQQIFVDEQPFYMRGLLHWGWYPLVGHTNPPDEVIRREVQAAKALGFNLVKFCLWIPPHRYFEILREEGMEAWLELPLWDPTADPARLEAISQEMERIVRQYRRHDNIVVWTVGCELSEATPAEYRQNLVRLVENLTGCPLVKDNSGGAEMYGGDLREFGSFYDFHPYCDTPFYPAVLDTLLPGPRREMPILLGEYNDIDVHRDIDKLGHELPYWVSSLPELNDQGVRWEQPMPAVLHSSRFALHPGANGHRELMESSRRKALFIRKTVHEAVRARDAIGGYVITGWRDTPISSSGFFDDWDKPRYSPDEVAAWNGSSCLFLIPVRRPPFVLGGNRPGFLDPLNHFAGRLFWKVGIHGDRTLEGGLVWELQNADGTIQARGTGERLTVPALTSTEVAQISCEVPPGDYRLRVEFAGVANEWSIWVVEKSDWSSFADWNITDPRELLKGLVLPGGDDVLSIGSVPDRGIGLLVDEGTIPMPFWRESANEFRNEMFWSKLPFQEQWERLLAVSPDRALDPDILPKGYEVLLNRIDTRTYKEHPILVRAGDRLITTLRPFGGLGVQPTSLNANPAGSALLAFLMKARKPTAYPLMA